MKEIFYRTTKKEKGVLSIIATQKVIDGYTEGGYMYAIFTSKHLIATGNISCHKFSEVSPVSDIGITLDNFIKRYNNE